MELAVAAVTAQSEPPMVTSGVAPKLEPEMVRVCAPEPSVGLTLDTEGVDAAEYEKDTAGN
jgi:hypothetical protein